MLTSTRRGHLVRRLAFLSALCPAIFPTRAEAQEWSGGIGAFVGVAFGQHDGLAWGFEAFGMRTFERQSSCSSQPHSGVGPLLQFALVGLHDPRVTFAVHGGRQFSRESFTSITGEVGATYRFGTDPGYGLHLGATPEWALLNASLRAQLFLDDYSATAGLRFLPTYGVASTSVCYVGRPLRAHEGFAPVRDRACRVAHSTGIARGPEGAGRGWERDAQHECASVPAFLQLAAELLAHDAPSCLVERALDAACDEIRHARSCAEMASWLLGYDVWPALPDFRSRPIPSVVRLAEESWLDGCLGEGAAAQRAGRAARVAPSARERAVQSRIAEDETRHAELAWDILRWTVDRAGSKARDAVGALHIAPAGDDLLDDHAAQCLRRRDDLIALR